MPDFFVFNNLSTYQLQSLSALPLPGTLGHAPCLKPFSPPFSVEMPCFLRFPVWFFVEYFIFLPQTSFLCGQRLPFCRKPPPFPAPAQGVIKKDINQTLCQKKAVFIS